MTHLGLISSVASACKGFSTICYDQDVLIIEKFKKGDFNISEPNLENYAAINSKSLIFTHDPEELKKCDVIYVAPDIPTDDNGLSNISHIDALLDFVLSIARIDACVVVLSQVPPGFTRKKLCHGRTLYYQVETLIFGLALERALHPERYIVGCDDPSLGLPETYFRFLDANNCPILRMRYESAELAKISINMCLVASVSTANTLAEICEGIGADWSEIVPALKLDKRIGAYSYLNPGLGISGGNLERDLATVCALSEKYATDDGVVRAWIKNSKHRKDWAARKIHDLLLNNRSDATIAIWGLAYKENTNSIKNSPSIATINRLPKAQLRIYDPVVPPSVLSHQNTYFATSALDAIQGADALLILTPWQEFKIISPLDIATLMRGCIVLDPYRVLTTDSSSTSRLEIHTLGVKALAKAANA